MLTRRRSADTDPPCGRVCGVLERAREGGLNARAGVDVVDELTEDGTGKGEGRDWDRFSCLIY